MKSSSNEGILLYVNSPGGGVYESDELYLKLKEYKEATGRPIWTYMGSQACSGGYYIAMQSDRVVANRNAWTGSIGVIITLTNLSELYDKLGIETIYYTSGKNKAMGAADAKVTDEQNEIFQSLVDESYEQFVEIVAEGRGMNVKKVKPIADGRIYTAKQALELNLIDSIDSYENTVKNFKDSIGRTVSIYSPKSSDFTFSSLFSMLSPREKKSDAEIMAEFLKNEGNGVPMYYAEPGKF